VREAREKNEIVVVSIFVNPIQFNDTCDLEKYPRTLQSDLKKLEAEGVDIVFTPSEETMYLPSRDTFVQVGTLANSLCGMIRGRSHFIGVCTVLAKLFNIIMPATVYMGQKDAQQAMIVQRMILDLNFPIELIVCPIVREADGLAMSSRNVRIPQHAREAAGILYKALQEGEKMLADGESNAITIINALSQIIIMEPKAELEYLEIRDLNNLSEVSEIKDDVLLAGAIIVEGVRLIDNVILRPT